MNRKDWKAQAEAYSKSAKVLLREGQHSAAYYIAGLAVECALKAKICRSIKRGDWPEKTFVNDIHVHDLTKLIRHAQLDKEREVEEKRSGQFRLYWNIVKGWKVESRYQLWSDAEARDMVEAVTRRGNGVLTWIRKRW
jgi:HEPN domain-containing protein